MQRNKVFLLAYILALQILDIVTTYLAIQNGARELNPVVNMLLGNAACLIILKIVVGLIVYKMVNKTLLIVYTVIMVQAILTNLFNTFH